MTSVRVLLDTGFHIVWLASRLIFTEKKKDENKISKKKKKRERERGSHVYFLGKGFLEDCDL